MMKWLLPLLIASSLFALPEQNYFDLLESYPTTLGILGSHEKGEIEIITNLQALAEIETIAKERLLKKGVSAGLATEWSQTGIIAEDQYLYWIRDGVIFPTGAKGTYDRIIWKCGLDGTPGVAILPYLEDRQIIVILNYRHATRSWEIELPRGARKEGETLRTAAARELKEETGYQLDEAHLLGILSVDSGILGSFMPILACKACMPGEREQEYSEAIHSHLVLRLEEIEEAIIQGFLEVTIHDKPLRASVRDPFLAYAVLHMKLRHWQN